MYNFDKTDLAMVTTAKGVITDVSKSYAAR